MTDESREPEPATPPHARRGYVSNTDAIPAVERPEPQPRGATSENFERRQLAQFRGAITRTVAGTLIPGLGLIGTKRHRLGIGVLVVFVAALIGLAYWVLRDPIAFVGNALDPTFMTVAGAILAVIAILWMVLSVGTYMTSRPMKVSHKQRLTGALVVALMTGLVTTPLSVGSAYALETAKLAGGMFDRLGRKPSQTRPSLDKNNPWANKDRVNILLLGGDSGEGREEDLGIRTDTIMMASIDTKSGNTVIIQLPRNLQNTPFPANSPLAKVYPEGFTDGGDSMLNSIWMEAPQAHPELFTDTAYPGADALKWAMHGLTGQPIDYFVLVNIDGLVQLIDAMGGVTVNVNYPIAKGGSTSGGDCGQDGWILEGPSQHLGGVDAMWYARSRCNSPQWDYSRMQRQSCLVKAVIDQADPARMATRYEQVAKATGNMVSTDIPMEHVDALVDLSDRVQNGKISRLAFIEGQNGFSLSDTDWALMRAQVSAALQESAPSPTSASPTADATSAPSAGPTAAATSAAETTAPETPAPETTAPETTAAAEPTTAETGDASSSQAPGSEVSGKAEDITNACAYRHEEPEWVDPSVPVYTPPAAEPSKR